MGFQNQDDRFIYHLLFPPCFQWLKPIIPQRGTSVEAPEVGLKYSDRPRVNRKTIDPV